MFTSRSEFRISARADNADLRLTEKANSLGVITHNRWEKFSLDKTIYEEVIEKLQGLEVSAKKWENLLSITMADSAKKRSAWELFRFNGVTVEKLVDALPELNININDIPRHVRTKVNVQGKYEPYISKQDRYVKAFQADEGMLLPSNFDYSILPSLSNECKTILNTVKPETIGQARRIQGVTAASLFELYKLVKSQQNTLRHHRKVQENLFSKTCADTSLIS